jgi:Enterobacter phage Enc34, ssDNA-binding protein
MGIKVRLENVRLSFAEGLHEAKSFEDGSIPKFGADFLLTEGHKVVRINPDKTKTTTTMKQVMIDVADEAWKGKGLNVLQSLEASKKCFRDGNKRVNSDGEVYEGYEDVKYVTAKNKRKPSLRKKSNDPDDPAGREDIYSGCYVNAVIEVYAMTDAKKKGVHAQLKGVQFVRDGDAFSGGGALSDDDFDDIDSGADAGDIGNDDAF